MKMFKILLTMCCGAAMAGSGAAMIIGDADGNYYVEGPAYYFVDWAVAEHAATTTGMATLLDPSKNYHFTTAETPPSEAFLDIPFTFAQPLVTARLDYGSVVNSSGSNYGWVQLDVTTDEGTTKVYFHHSPDTDQSESMNHTPEGGVPTGGTERQRAYTNIDDLVAGKSEFTLNVSVLRVSAYVYDGGCFLPDREATNPPLWPESDFILSGTMVPADPNYCGDLYTEYLAGDVSGPAGVSDCYVNLYDFAVIAKQWLECTDPENVDCDQ